MKPKYKIIKEILHARYLSTIKFYPCFAKHTPMIFSAHIILGNRDIWVCDVFTRGRFICSNINFPNLKIDLERMGFQSLT